MLISFRRQAISAISLLLVLGMSWFTFADGALPRHHAAPPVNCTPTTDANGNPTTELIRIDPSCVTDSGPMPTKINAKRCIACSGTTLAAIHSHQRLLSAT